MNIMTFPIVVESNVVTPDELRKLYARCIAAWGVRLQEDMAKEECAELIVEISHAQRGRSSEENIIEEVADVLFTVGQLIYMYGFTADELKEAVDVKVVRTSELLQKFEHNLAEQTKFKSKEE